MKLLILFVFATFGSFAFSQSTSQEKIDYYKYVIGYLAADSMHGRAIGTKEDQLISQFIQAELKSVRKMRTKQQEFSFVYDSINYQSQNIIGFYNNHAPSTILITAHYDHIGLGGKLSNSQGVHAVHNGADDNASGVAMLLSLAKSVANLNAQFNYMFVGYGAHEVGLFGSEYFARNLPKKLKNIHLALNFDMIGRLTSNQSLYYDNNDTLQNPFAKISAPKLKLVDSTSDRINLLDSKWLAQNGIPSVTISTGKHIDYHKITDDIEYINFEGLALIETFLIDWFNTRSEGTNNPTQKTGD
ncbi:MAG: M28 family peptidase [Crocinitomix sp.]|nr:M28 family peptidase [Crocinitomix sp.]